jgi:hypothetical protein
VNPASSVRLGVDMSINRFIDWGFSEDILVIIAHTGKVRWVWQSIRPGITQESPRSRTFASEGISSLDPNTAFMV